MQALNTNEAEELARACDAMAALPTVSHTKADRDAEELAIAGVLQEVIHASATQLRPWHFHEEIHRKIWAASEKCKGRLMPSDAGITGADWDRYTRRLVRASEWPGIEQRVVRAAATRKLVLGLDDVLRKLSHGGSQVLDECVDQVATLQTDCSAGLPDEAVTMREAIIARVEQLRDDAKRSDNTLTMHPQLQEVYGGWRRKKVYAIVARSSEHKTTFGLDALDRICKAGGTGVIFTMEDDASDMAARCMARNTRFMDLKQISTAAGGCMGPETITDLQELTASSWVTRQRVIDVGAPKWGQVKALLHAAHAKQKIDAVALDYGQLIQPDKSMGLYDHFRVVSAEAQRLAKEMDCVLFIMLQVDKQAGRDSREADKPPSTLDAMGGAMWHNNVFGSVCLSKNEDGTLTAWMDKWKDGPQQEFRLGLRASKDQILD